MTKFNRRQFALFSLLGSAITLALAGCTSSFSGTQSVTGTPAVAAKPGQITGIVHGGQQPITGATVALWAAGETSTYGQGATLVATTTTDDNGNFNLNTSASGGTVSACTPGTLNYITATGGNPGAGTNSYAALMLALPQPCGSSTGGLTVTVNEVTTAASVLALRQFMSITPANGPYTGGAVPWQIGAPSSNVIGLQNAFLQVPQLVSIVTGTSAATTVTNTVSYTNTSTITYPLASNTYTTTITPDSSRLYMLADVLAACVNTMDNQGNTGSVVCTNLFADVSTAQTGTGPATPTDTIQVAYDIANAPGGIVIAPVNGATTGATLTNASKTLTVPTAPQSIAWAYYMCDQYVGAIQPFTTSACAAGSSSATAYPGDFQVGIRWAATDTAGDVYGQRAGSNAVDSQGNLWTFTYEAPSSGTSGAVVAEWDPTGRVVQAVSGTVTIPASNLNVWETSSTSPYNPSTTSTAISAPQTAVTLPSYVEDNSSQVPYTLAVDTNNNAWFTDFVGTGSITTPAELGVQSSFNEGLLVQVAPAVIAACSSVPCTNGTSTAGAVTPYFTGAYPASIAIDGANNVWVSASGTTNSASAGDLMLQTAASGYLNIYEGQYLSGNNFRDIVVDGASHNVWGFIKTSTVGKDVYRSSLNVEVNNASTYATLASLNIGGVTIVPQYGTVDSSGNAWVGEGDDGTGSLAYFNVTAAGSSYTSMPSSDMTITASTTNTSGTTAENYSGGLDAPSAFVVDGANNVWIGNGVTSTNSGISLFYNSGATPGTNIALSPDLDAEGSYGFNGDGTDEASDPAIDSAGNLYLGAGRNSYDVHIPGAAAPVVAPVSVASGLGSTAAITAWSIDGTGVNATFTTSTPPAVGAVVLLYGFGTSTFFNNQVVTVTASVAGTSFTAVVTGGTASTSNTETGSGSYIPVGNGKIGVRP